LIIAAFTMNAQLLRDLRNFGLTEHEAKAWLALSVKGPLTAGALARVSGISDSKVYNAIHRLAARSLVEIAPTKPTRYKAADPSQAISMMIEEQRKQIDALQQRFGELLSNIKPAKENPAARLWMACGRRGFLIKATEVLDRTEKLGCGMTGSFSRTGILDRAFSAAIKRGVKIRLLGTSPLTRWSAARARWYHRLGAEIRILPMSLRPVLGLGDRKEAALRVDNGPDSEFVWSGHPSMVGILSAYFDSLWERAKPVRF
jgi:sugar-specific transcriptional regulator TrmB